MDYQISTMTMTTQLPECELCLLNVGKYLGIDKDIIGIKYNYSNFSVLKGKYSTSIFNKAKNKKESQINKRLFYNQISLVVQLNHLRPVNVKLFSNGSIHVTGCKDTDDCNKAAKVIYLKLCGLRDRTSRILLTKDKYDVLTDSDNLVYSYREPFTIIGWRSGNGNYSVHRKDVYIDHKTRMFLSRTEHAERRRHLYNLSGECIGYTHIDLINNRSKYYRKNTKTVPCDGDSDLVYFNNSVLLGSNTYVVDKTRITDTDSHGDVFEIDYSCCPFVNREYTLDNMDFKCDIHCINVHFDLGQRLDLLYVQEFFCTLGYFCKYKPETYTGVKLLYKLNNHVKQSGDFPSAFVCKCMSECLCTNVTFLIFGTGKVISTGYKCLPDIDRCVSHFKKFRLTTKRVTSE